MNRIIPPSPVQPITNNGELMNQPFMLWTQAVSGLSPFIGAGSPEGNLDAPQYSEYINSAGTSGAIKWIKMQPSIAGDTKRGWVLL